MKEQKLKDFEVFKNEEFGQVITMTVEDKPYFEAIRVAEILGYKKGRNAIARHCRHVIRLNVPHPQSETKLVEKLFIPEGDLYRLIIGSKLPSAERFEKWVFDEVLPTIRKHGMYITQEKLNLRNEELMKEVELYKNRAQESIDKARSTYNYFSTAVISAILSDSILARLSAEFGLSVKYLFNFAHDRYLIELEDETDTIDEFPKPIGWRIADALKDGYYTMDIMKPEKDKHGKKTGRSYPYRQFTDNAYDLIKDELIACGYKPMMTIPTLEALRDGGSQILSRNPKDFIVVLNRPHELEY